MTEREWLTAVVPYGIISTTSGEKSKRKLRLFTCACCRQVFNPFVPGVVVRAMAAAEAFADGEITAETLERVRAAVGRAFADSSEVAVQLGTGYLRHLYDACGWACMPHPNNEARAAGKAAKAAARAAGDVPWPAAGELHDGCPEEFAAQADLARDIFGNPFREVEFDPAWRTSDVLAMAQGMYSNRDFSAMPILADALQDAGCEEDDVLLHCREAREHVRGCWVVDLLLGMK